MRPILLGFLLVVGSAGCGKDVTKDIEKFADRACECTDATCAREVIKDFVSFAKDNSSARGDNDRAMTAAQKIGRCVVEAGMPPAEVQAEMGKL